MKTLPVLLGAPLIAASILFVFRWDISATPEGVVRMDSWTGAVTFCRITDIVALVNVHASPVDCTPAPSITHATPDGTDDEKWDAVVNAIEHKRA